MSVPWKTAWITGASSGIGRALALALARRGVVVAASAPSGAPSGDDLEAVATEVAQLRGNGAGRILPTPLDVTDRAAVKAAAEAVIRVFGGPPDLAVLNAGIYRPIPAWAFDAARFRDQVEVNLMGTVHMLEALLPAYLAARRGHIAVVASVMGYLGSSTGAGYGASKAALINLCESLKLDLDRTGVKLQLVNPGFVKTPLTDNGEFRKVALMPVEKAVERMLAGFQSKRFEITFPKRFTWTLKLLRSLPYPLFFALLRPRADR